MSTPETSRGPEYHFDPNAHEANADFLAELRWSVEQHRLNVERARETAEHMEKLRRWYLLRVLLLECGLTDALAGANARQLEDAAFSRKAEAETSLPRFVVIILDDESGPHLVIRDEQDQVDLPLTRIEQGDKWVAHRLADELNYWRAGVLDREPPAPETPAYVKYARAGTPS